MHRLKFALQGTCILKKQLRVKKIGFYFTDVTPTVTTPVIQVHKIQTCTFLDAEFAKERVGQVYFYNGNLQHSQFYVQSSTGTWGYLQYPVVPSRVSRRRWKKKERGNKNKKKEERGNNNQNQEEKKRRRKITKKEERSESK